MAAASAVIQRGANDASAELGGSKTNAVCGQCVNTDRQMLAVPFDRIESHD